MGEPVLYPASLDLGGLPCLVVGGGEVAARKVVGLLEAGAVVTVVAPELAPAMAGLSVTVCRRPYESPEAASYRLVLTATGRPEVDAQVFEDARGAGVFVNSADDPDHCTFQLPAIWRDGRVSVAVSSAGASPALGQWLRQRIAADFGEGIGALADLFEEARRQLQAEGRRTDALDWSALLAGPLPGLVRQHRLDEAKALLERALDDVRASPP